MTPEEIRVSAYNAITSALVADHDAKTTGCSGDDDCRQVAELARLAAIAVGALGHMLPVDRETTTRYVTVDDPRELVASLIGRYVGAWTEVTD